MIIPSKNNATTPGVCTLSDYAPLIGPEAADRTCSKARGVSAAHAVHVSLIFLSESLRFLSEKGLIAGLINRCRVESGLPYSASVNTFAAYLSANCRTYLQVANSGSERSTWLAADWIDLFTEFAVA